VVHLRIALLGLTAATLLAAVGGIAWVTLRTPEADAAGEAVRLPPAAMVRIAEGRDYDACLDRIREDAEDARHQAEAWEAAGGGDGARHCHGLALLAMGEAVRAAERLEAMASRSRAPGAARAAVFGHAGQAWILARQPSRAFAALTMGLVLAPDDVELLIDRALALGAMGRNAEAVDDLDRVLALDARRAEALVLRAAAKRRLDRLAEAERDVTGALALGPDNAEALLERGILRQLRGDLAGARADWARAASLAPDTATADLAEQNLALSDAGPQRR
jgi:Flp pilus assembly protein TadD